MIFRRLFSLNTSQFNYGKHAYSQFYSRISSETFICVGSQNRSNVCHNSISLSHQSYYHSNRGSKFLLSKHRHGQQELHGILHPYFLQERALHRGRTRLSGANKEEKIDKEEPVKLTLYQKFKSMYRDYWYVLVPVHVVTSAFWFGTFYYMARTGVDIAALAEMANFGEEILEKIRKAGNSLAGHLAISYLLYKVATPLRYTVTLGGTTISINYLKKWGWIKPMPKRDELKKMFDDKKVELRKKRESFRERQELMRRSVMNKMKLTSKKRMKKTSDMVKRILQRRRNQNNKKE